MPECTLCKTSKPESEFHKNIGSPSGITPRCKECRNSIAKSKRYKRESKRIETISRKEKSCISCGVIKNLDQFPKNKNFLDGSLGMCILCRRSYKKNRYKLGGKEKQNTYYHKKKEKINARNKEKRDLAKIELLNLLGGKCSHCHVSACTDLPVACFDFHHETGGKEMELSKMTRFVTPYNNESIFIELSKCIVLCANCHRKHHYLNGR